MNKYEQREEYIKRAKLRIRGLTASINIMSFDRRDVKTIRKYDGERLRFAGILNMLEKEKRDDNNTK